ESAERIDDGAIGPAARYVVTILAASGERHGQSLVQTVSGAVDVPHPERPRIGAERKGRIQHDGTRGVDAESLVQSPPYRRTVDLMQLIHLRKANHRAFGLEGLRNRRGVDPGQHIGPIVEHDSQRVDGARSPVRGMDPNAVTARTAVELDEGRDVERVLQAEPASRASGARGRAAAARDHRVAWLSDEPAREVLRATVRLHARAAMTEARHSARIGELERLRTGAQLAHVVPAIDVEAARQRAVDDGPEQPV